MVYNFFPPVTDEPDKYTSKFGPGKPLKPGLAKAGLCPSGSGSTWVGSRLSWLVKVGDEKVTLSGLSATKKKVL